MEPWIKLYRKFKEWEWYGDVVVMSVFIHLLLSASWKPKKWKGITIDTGEVVTSIGSLAKELHLSVQQTRTALDRLQDSKVINKQTTNRFTLIKVLNYCKYQDSDFFDNKQINKQTTNEQQTNNKQTTTSKEIKNDINKELYIEEAARVRAREGVAKVINLYEQNIGVPSPITRDVLADLLNSHSADLLELAIKEAAKANAHSIKYIEAIFRKWDSLGIKDVNGALHAIAEHNRNVNESNVVKVTTGFVNQKKNFFQDYNDDEMSEFELQLIRQRVGDAE